MGTLYVFFSLLVIVFSAAKLRKNIRETWILYYSSLWPLGLESIGHIKRERGGGVPYSLSTKPAERTRLWEGEDTDLSNIPQRRCSISSTPGEVSYRPDTLPRASSLSEVDVQHELPTTPKFNITPSLSASRVERLVRERQLRKNVSYTLVDEAPDGKVEASMGPIGCCGGGGGDGGATGGGIECSQDNNVGTSGLSEKGQQQQRATQRLLVVANRLPVSAQRDGDNWDLKLSAGGLVSALLGMFLDCFLKHFGSLRQGQEMEKNGSMT